MLSLMHLESIQSIMLMTTAKSSLKYLDAEEKIDREAETCDF